MALIVSSTEPASLRAIATTVSQLPEIYGADVLFLVDKGEDENGEKLIWRVGIQRKEYHDLLASVMDGRLAKEVAQMQSLDYKILIVEGEPQWTNDGQMVLDGRFGQSWSEAQWKGLLWSVQDRDIWVDRTNSLSSTITTIQLMERWFSKTSHSSLSTRPGLGTNLWGGPSNKDYLAWILQGFPGVGHNIASRIVEMYGLPMKLTVGVEDLMKVEGIGKVKAEQIVRLFDGVDDDR